MSLSIRPRYMTEQIYRCFPVEISIRSSQVYFDRLSNEIRLSMRIDGAAVSITPALSSVARAVRRVGRLQFAATSFAIT